MAKKEVKKGTKRKTTLKKKLTEIFTGNQEENVEEVNPQEVIEEFTEAAKKLDTFVTADKTQEESKELLEKELEKAEEVEAKLEKTIEQQEEKIKNKPRVSNIWGGVIDGWYN